MWVWVEAGGGGEQQHWELPPFAALLPSRPFRSSVAYNFWEPKVGRLGGGGEEVFCNGESARESIEFLWKQEAGDLWPFPRLDPGSVSGLGQRGKELPCTWGWGGGQLQLPLSILKASDLETRL